MQPGKLQAHRGFGGSLKAHLRDSVRTVRTLQHHLSREALPHLDNYHAQQTAGGLRPTLDELHLGTEPRSKKVKFSNFYTENVLVKLRHHSSQRFCLIHVRTCATRGYGELRLLGSRFFGLFGAEGFQVQETRRRKVIYSKSGARPSSSCTRWLKKETADDFYYFIFKKCHFENGIKVTMLL